MTTSDNPSENPILADEPGGSDPAQKVPNKERSVARSAGIVSIAVMISRVFGLVREMVFSRLFGAGYLFDAYIVGFRIPNLLRDLFAEGALSVAFVKVFTDYQVNVSEKEAWRLAALIFNGLAVVLSALVVVGILGAPYYVPYLAYGFPPEKAALAVTLTQIMFPFILFIALAAVAMGVLNTKGRFAIPASASTAFNIVSIIVGVSIAYWISGGGWNMPSDPGDIPEMPAQWAIIGMSVGTLFGGLSQILIQVPSLIGVGFRFRPLISFTDKGVRRVMRLMGPAIIGTSAVQVKVMVDTFMVSGIEGGNSWLPYAFRLMQFPIGVFGVAIGVASLPTLARLGSENKIGEFRSTLSSSLGLVFFMTIPSACGLIILGRPIISLIYEGGAFNFLDTNMTAWALAAYSVGLAGYAAIKVLSPSFYALEDAKTPMYVSLASIAVHVFFSYTLLNVFSGIAVDPSRPNGLGHVGVALATSIVAMINFLALLILMRRKIQRIELRKILDSFVRIALASAVMSAVAWLTYSWLANGTGYGSNTLGTRLLHALVPVFAGAVVFFVMAKLLRVRELDQMLRIFMKRFGRT
ncbi:MAG: murein biosynthesis integral membrane protein MurJ [Acidobacteria bacterium]|nr:MAG: murein biosynthesis integral membrane protein MurJ [Acidobacteriota bacterium]REK02403.1 MAG: murein biosynthesis integral membrane protein MurJ [Acidobacteriota bacterium]REK13795.1 MAG: murein biosynthesis integral membrane protein MurJ [Acidobacteriota bacterium]REK41789.1 MAG: murein biosynthesis integral membrane protein MurJ [Acidobacteriota bacterium]